MLLLLPQLEVCHPTHCTEQNRTQHNTTQHNTTATLLTLLNSQQSLLRDYSSCIEDSELCSLWIEHDCAAFGSEASRNREVDEADSDSVSLTHSIIKKNVTNDDHAMKA